MALTFVSTIPYSTVQCTLVLTLYCTTQKLINSWWYTLGTQFLVSPSYCWSRFKIACYDCVKIILRQNKNNEGFSESRDLNMTQGFVKGQNINFTKTAIVNGATCIGGLGAIPPGQHQLPPRTMTPPHPWRQCAIRVNTLPPIMTTETEFRAVWSVTPGSTMVRRGRHHTLLACWYILSM